MLTAFGRAFTTPDLRRKILFTLFVILLYRLGSNVTVPGIDFAAVQDLQRQADQLGTAAQGGRQIRLVGGRVEGDLGHPRMVHERLARLAPAVNVSTATFASPPALG